MVRWRGGLAAILLGTKTGREFGGEALKLGGMAAVGALAYKAYRDWQAGKDVPAAPPAQPSVPMLPAPSGTPFNPSSESGQQKLARHLLRAMIAAAKSDGHVDAQEQARIFARRRRGHESAGSGLRSDPVEFLAQFGGRRLAAIDRHMRWIRADTHDRRRLGQGQTRFGLFGPSSRDVGQRLARAQALPAIGLAPGVLDGAHEAVGAFDQGAEAGGHVGSRVVAAAAAS